VPGSGGGVFGWYVLVRGRGHNEGRRRTVGWPPGVPVGVVLFPIGVDGISSACGESADGVSEAAQRGVDGAGTGPAPSGSVAAEAERVAARAHPREESVEHHHRDVQGGAARAAVFGISDGLVTNVSLILGVVGAHPSIGFLRVAGLAGLLSGACSMAAGEYVSMRAQRELLERELAVEAAEIRRHPHAERRELARLYERRGLTRAQAEEMAASVMADPDRALETHAREELGIDPNSLGSPVAAALSSFGSFAVGAAVPLVPWLVSSGTVATAASIGAAALAAILVGVALAFFTGRSKVRSAARQLIVAAVAAGITFAVGTLIGASGLT